MNCITSFATRNKMFLVGFFLLTWFSSQLSCGFMMAMVSPLAIIYQFVKLARCRRDPWLRKDRYLALAVIAFSLLLVISAHLHRHNDARRVANKLVADILSFQKATGRYPSGGKELGLPEMARLRPYRLTYYNVEGQPRLFYVATFGPFDKYQYDFTDKTWNYLAD